MPHLQICLQESLLTEFVVTLLKLTVELDYAAEHLRENKWWWWW